MDSLSCTGACDDRNLSVGNALKHEPRKSPSVDKDGNPDGTGYGFGWFPGYAINVDTGERLNIMFSEDFLLYQTTTEPI